MACELHSTVLLLALNFGALVCGFGQAEVQLREVMTKYPDLATKSTYWRSWMAQRGRSKMNSTDGCPDIVSRADWGARPPKATPEVMQTPVPFVIIHHTDGPRCDDYKTCSAYVRGIQNFHMDYRGWDDIGYTFLAGEDGNIYEGRGWDAIGAHCPWYNNQSIGISVLGNYTNVTPMKIATDAVQKLIQCAVERGKLSPDYILYGHRQGKNGTACPGDAFFKEIQSWPHWKPGDHFPPNGTLALDEKSLEQNWRVRKTHTCI